MSLDELKQRESRFFLPVVNRLPLALVEGRGARVRDVDGVEYTDLTAGWGVTCIGHCHPRLVEAIATQAGRLMQTTNIFYTLPQLELIERQFATDDHDRSLDTDEAMVVLRGRLHPRRPSISCRVRLPDGAVEGRVVHLDDLALDLHRVGDVHLAAQELGDCLSDDRLAVARATVQEQ